MRTLLTPLAVLVLAAPLAAASVHHAVDIEGFAYDPSPLFGVVGDSVTWTNRDTAVHTVTCDAVCDYASPTLTQGQSFSAVLSVAGTYEYFCEVHTSMRGVVRVGTGDASSPDLAPDAATLRAARPPLLAGVGAVPDPTRATLSVDVANDGGSASTAVDVAFLVRDAATGEYALVGTATLPALAAGERATATVAWTGAPLSGSADVRVDVDSANALVEATEANNAAAGTVAVGIL